MKVIDMPIVHMRKSNLPRLIISVPEADLHIECVRVQEHKWETKFFDLEMNQKGPILFNYSEKDQVPVVASD
jgi:hypothetical protein